MRTLIVAVLFIAFALAALPVFAVGKLFELMARVDNDVFGPED